MLFKPSRKLLYETSSSSIYLVQDKKEIIKKVYKEYEFRREKKILETLWEKPSPYLLEALWIDNRMQEFTFPRATMDLFEWVFTQHSLVHLENIPLFWQYILDLTKGLQHLSTHHIEHYDIKPENLLIFPTGRLKIGDFGLAVCHQEKYRSMRGTFSYMAPEIVTENHFLRDIYIASSMDVYSASISILYCLFPQILQDHQSEMSLSCIKSLQCQFQQRSKEISLYAALFPILLHGIETYPCDRCPITEWCDHVQRHVQEIIAVLS